jgi:RNA polymerase subunit RPABC4/transcription elongation factor Spt4
MSKAHRGKGIRSIMNRGRDNCPVCKRTSLKVMYEQEMGEKKIKVCKQCKAAISNGTIKEVKL